MQNRDLAAWLAETYGLDIDPALAEEAAAIVAGNVQTARRLIEGQPLETEPADYLRELLAQAPAR